MLYMNYVLLIPWKPISTTLNHVEDQNVLTEFPQPNLKTGFGKMDSNYSEDFF